MADEEPTASGVSDPKPEQSGKWHQKEYSLYLSSVTSYIITC